MLIGQVVVENRTEVVATTLAGWQSHFPQLGVLILLPEAEKDTLPALQALFRARQVAMAGAIFPALLNEQAFLPHGICLIAFDHMPAHFMVGNLLDKNSQKLGKAALKLLEADQSKVRSPTLFLIFDGILPNIASLLNELHAVIGERAHKTGVNAGSETFQPMPCLFDSEQVIGNGVLGLLLTEKISTAVKHGYPVAKSLMSATSTVGNRIDTINHRPAFEMYQEVIKAEYGISLTRENFYDHAVHFPFGLVTVLDILVRIPVAVTEDGALLCVGEVPPNTRLKLLRAPVHESSLCIEQIAEALDAISGTTENRPLLTFYCAGRRMHFGAQASAELAQLQTITRPSILCGALTLGEIDCIEELNLLPRFHNAALVCLKF